MMPIEQTTDASLQPACGCDRPGYGCEIHGPQPREHAVLLGCGHKTWRVDGRCDQQHSKTTVLLGGDAA